MLFLRTLNPDGTLLQEARLASTASDVARAIAVGPGGSVYIAGSTAGALPGESSLGGTDAFLANSVAAPAAAVRCTGCYFLINGVRATLTFHAGEIGNGSTFTYNYRGSAQTVQFVSSTVSQILINGNSATFSGQGTLNGQPGYGFTVTAKDGGATGSGLDTVSISITGPNNYSHSATGNIVGGDIILQP